ncbi:MAG: RNase J family beta-CASP ribonuclease, partial [Clostridia bacterium]|nr:RNase J family beta-CASP ribonuclease [Clostridia bacterium]
MNEEKKKLNKKGTMARAVPKKTEKPVARLNSSRPVRQAWEPKELPPTTHGSPAAPKKKQNEPPARQKEKREKVPKAVAPKQAARQEKGRPAPAAIKQKSAPVQEKKAKTRPTDIRRAPQGGKKKPLGKLRVMSLGGLQEIGKNMTVIEYENDIIVVDCGFGFPDEEMLGVDYVIPDITYLEKNADRIRGILITHGHEDHIGAIPYVLRTVNPPIYGTRLTLGIIRNKLAEHKLPHQPRLMTVEAGDTVQLGVMLVEFIHVNHSIADACALAIRTPLGVVFHSGDFKLDVTPIDGNMMDITRIGEIGNEGVLLMLCESTNAERAGFSPSERMVGGSLDRIFAENKDNRLVIATFSSNVHRVQQIIDCSVKYGRRVAILGRSMENVIGAATELGYMNVPKGTIIEVGELRRFTPGQVTLVTTGSQGEPMSALYRMAFGSHDRVKLTPQDTVVLSSSAIPGNELLVDHIINALITTGITVVSDATTAGVHASGHACSEELKLMHAL